MIPELGKYAVEVSLAYGVGLSAITLLVTTMVIRSRRIARDLKQAEDRINA